MAAIGGGQARASSLRCDRNLLGRRTFCSKIYPRLHVRLLVFAFAATIFEHVSSPFQAKSCTCSRRKAWFRYSHARWGHCWGMSVPVLRQRCDDISIKTFSWQTRRAGWTKFSFKVRRNGRATVRKCFNESWKHRDTVSALVQPCLSVGTATYCCSIRLNALRVMHRVEIFCS